ncbi:MAG TPA: hypothetical protein VN306_10375 [Mycobacterium sp.]|nr:hypothetical protein [Mycobacterium sp.]
MANDEFDNPGTATAINLEELNGRLLLIKPSRVEVGVSTVLGNKDATVADVHVLDGDAPGQLYGEAFIWPKVLQAQLHSTVSTGRYCLGRLGQGVAKPGQNPPWKLEDPTEDDKQRARKYLADLAAEPVTAPDNSGCPF